MPTESTDVLRCPHCHAALHREAGVYSCDSGHAFDVAKQGYVNLHVGPSLHVGDRAAMLDARNSVLVAGHLDLVTRALVDALRGPLPAGVLVEVGAGTGHHLARAQKVLGTRQAVAIDASVAAAKRAARAGGAAWTSVVADAWGPWPLLDGSAAAVLSIFAPRNLRETARVLEPGGRLVVIVPAVDHLVELAEPFEMLTVDPGKETGLRQEAQPLLSFVDTCEIRGTRRLDRASARAIATMGPSGFHLDAAALDRGAASLPDRLTVTIAVRVLRFEKR